MTLEEYVVKRCETLEADNAFLKNSLSVTADELEAMQDAYEELKGFIKKYALKCNSNTGFKFDKYFWENDPEYDFLVNLLGEGEDA